MSRTYGSITIVDTTDIESIVIEYAQNQDSANAPAKDYSGWSTDRPTWKQGYFVWQRTRIHKAGTTADKDELGTAVCITGSTGSTGGAGRSLTGTETKYTNVALNTTETQVKALAESNWGTNVPAYDAAKPDYWVRIKNTYSSGTTVQYIYYKDNGLTSAVSTAAAANTTANQANQTANEANTTAGEAHQLAEQANEMVGRYTILWNYSSFTSSDNGQAYICAYDPITGVKSDANGWVKWNNTKRTITKQMVNPNTILPYNIPIYIVCRLSSSTATTGTNYMVWYNSGWKYAACPTPTAVGGTWTWTDATDIVLGKFVEPSSEGAFSECEIYNPPWSAKQVTSNTTTNTGALSVANTALTSANGKNKVVYGSSTPGTSGYVNGDTWFKYGTGDDAARIIGVYKFNGSSWVEQPLTSETFAYIDAGKITAGDIAAARLQAGVISAVNSSTETSGGSSLKISADKVNIEGAAIFMSGRLSETSLNNTYDEISAAAAADAQERIDNIEIGGRNLYALSKSVTGYIRASEPLGDIVLTPANPQHSTSDYISVSPGDVFTTQMWNPNLVNNTSNSNRGVAWYDSEKNHIVSWNGSGDANGARPLGKAYWKWTFNPAPENAAYARFGFIIGPSTNTIDPDIKIKVEKGNKATDWSPAPQDVDASIAAVSTVANAAAPKASAVAKTQRIYYRSNSSTKPTGYPTAWVTDETNKWNSNATTTTGWSRRATPISNGKGENVTKYLYLWTATQKQMVNGTVVTLTANDIALDDSTTVIDGGNIITGTVTANQIAANAITAEKIQTGAISIGKLSQETQSELNKPNLTPCFSATPYQVGNFWFMWPTTAGYTYTYMGDGWVRVQADNTSGSSTIRSDPAPIRTEEIKPNTNYTFLMQFRNNNSTGACGGTYIVQTNNCQFWGNTTVKTLESTDGVSGASVNLKTQFVPGTAGVFTRRVVKTSEPTDSTHWVGAVKGLFSFTFQTYAGGTLDIETRISIYEGEYTGVYKPWTIKNSQDLQKNIDTFKVGGTNLLVSNTAVVTPTSYNALDVYLSEELEENQPYVLQLWDVDVSHTGKNADTLNVSIYYCGGAICIGGWQGTSYITNGHADHLVMYFTPYANYIDTTGVNRFNGGNGYGLSHQDVGNATNKYIRFYNSPSNATGTKNLTIGRYKLEKGNTPTAWSSAEEDLQANIDDSVNQLENQINVLNENIETNNSAISNSIQDLADSSLIKLGKAEIIGSTQVNAGSLILRKDNQNYMQLGGSALILVSNGIPVATIYGEDGFGQLIANNCQISTLKLRSEGGRQGSLAWVARENGHLSLKQITDN